MAFAPGTVNCPRQDLSSQFRQDFFGSGEPPLVQFGEDQLPVHDDLEFPAAGRDQGQALNGLLEFQQQGARQTDGLLFIPSEGTVGQFDFHLSVSFPTVFRLYGG